jgi:hypothetical protein
LLPAWMVDVEYEPTPTGTRLGVDGGPATDTAYILAVAPSQRRGPEVTETDDREQFGWRNRAVRLSRDGRTLYFQVGAWGFMGGPLTCRDVAASEVVETRTAVLLPVRIRPVPDMKDCGDPASTDEHWRAEIRLSRPLGNRVIVTAADGGAPYPAFACEAVTSAIVPACDPPQPDPPGTAPRLSVGPGSSPYGEEFGPERPES